VALFFQQSPYIPFSAADLLSAHDDFNWNRGKEQIKEFID